MDVTIPAPGFDEATYLGANPDVAEAVGKGSPASGWMHALTFGYREQRAGLPAGVRAQIEAFWMDYAGANAEHVPPEALRVRVSGGSSLPEFYLVGWTIANDIDETLAQSKIEIAADAKVLDFGCGCGRVLHHVARRHPEWKLCGSDIDGEAVGWCRERMAG